MCHTAAATVTNCARKPAFAADAGVVLLLRVRFTLLTNGLGGTICLQEVRLQLAKRLVLHSVAALGKESRNVTVFKTDAEDFLFGSLFSRHYKTGIGASRDITKGNKDSLRTLLKKTHYCRAAFGEVTVARDGTFKFEYSTLI